MRTVNKQVVMGKRGAEGNTGSVQNVCVLGSKNFEKTCAYILEITKALHSLSQVTSRQVHHVLPQHCADVSMSARRLLEACHGEPGAQRM